MNKQFLIVGACAFAVCSSSANIYSNQSVDSRIPALNPKSISDSGVSSPIGTFWSEVQDDGTFTNVSTGYACRESGLGAGFYRIADDFMITNGKMVITGFKGYAFRTGMPLAPLSDANVNFLDGSPAGTPNVLASASVFGGEAAIIPVSASGASVAKANVFRCFNTATPPGGGVAPNLMRQVQEMSIPISPPLVLGPGTYWVDYQLNQPLPAASQLAFAPSTTHDDSRGVPSANGLIKNELGVWTAMVDQDPGMVNPPVRQEQVFILEGHVIRWDEDYTIAMGQFFGGDLNSLKANDDNILYILCDESAPVSDLRINFKTNIAWTSNIQVKMISSSDRTGQIQRVFFEKNPINSGDWTPYEVIATTTVDRVSTILVDGAVSDHVGPGGEVRMRVRVDPTEDLIASDGWSNKYGFMEMRCLP